MFINVELEVNHKLLRGDVRLPRERVPSLWFVFIMAFAWIGLARCVFMNCLPESALSMASHV